MDYERKKLRLNAVITAICCWTAGFQANSLICAIVGPEGVFSGSQAALSVFQILVCVFVSWVCWPAAPPAGEGV